jgi:hypothetical protein
MARRKQRNRDPNAKRNEFIVRSDEPLLSREARRAKLQHYAECNICGQYIEKDMLRSHVRQVHKSAPPNARLQEIRDDPGLVKLRGHAISPSPHEVDLAQWHFLRAYKQEVDWFANYHAKRIDPKLLDEVMHILRSVERAFTDGWIKIRTPRHEQAPSEPPEYKPPWIHVVAGGLPGSGR